MVEPSVKTGGEKVEDTQILDLYWERDEQAISESDKRYGRYCHVLPIIFCMTERTATSV